MPKILVLCEYYHPDDVAAAKFYTDFCEGLTDKGWEVEVWPANRSCHHYQDQYPLQKEDRNGVVVRRIWRPAWRQHSFWGRILNSLWTQKYWWWRLAFSFGVRPDVILTGTAPLFGILLSPFLRFLRPKARIVHWCFDLYPEIAIGDGLIAEKGIIAKVIRFFLKRAYRSCDLVADLGPCMGRLLNRYSTKPSVTLNLWSTLEPPERLAYESSERREIFGESSLGLFYSGSFGRGHDFYLTLKLARLMRGSAIFTYSDRGSRLNDLKGAVNPEDTNIRFAPFAPPDRLLARLSAPDVQIVSLRPEWSGMMVPSKFFGALAVGRPVLFEGSEDSDIALWIKEYGLGWVLKADNLDFVAEELLRFSKNQDRKNDMFKHCHEIYQAHFTKKAVMDKWDYELRALLSPTPLTNQEK